MRNLIAYIHYHILVRDFDNLKGNLLKANRMLYVWLSRDSSLKAFYSRIHFLKMVYRSRVNDILNGQNLKTYKHPNTCCIYSHNKFHPHSVPSKPLPQTKKFTTKSGKNLHCRAQNNTASLVHDKLFSPMLCS